MPRLCSMMLLLLWGTGAAGAQGWEDGFAGKTLGARWQWRVPVAGPTLSLGDKPGWLRIRLPDRAGGFNHWNDPKPVDEAPQLRAPAPEGDWELEARLQLQQLDAANNFQVGLVVGVSDDLLLTFGPMQGPSLPGGPKAPEVWLEPTGLSGFFRTPGEARDLRLRLVRTGSICRARLSRDGANWVEAGCYLLPPAPRFVGLIGKTFSPGPPLVFDVDYVRLTPLPSPGPAGRRALVGVGGEYPTGYRGLLARHGLPHEVLLDYQLADLEVLRRFELLLIGDLSEGIAGRAGEALMRYVREGGTVLLDSRSGAFLPESAVPGRGARVDGETIPDIVVGGSGNPLTPLLGETTRFARGESRFHFDPSSMASLQVLARYDGKPGVSKPPRPAQGYTGAPAVWAKPLGRGLLVYSSPSIGASLSWGPSHDLLAEALIQLLGKGRLESQLIPEGARFGRKQSGITAKEPTVDVASPDPPAFTLRRLTSQRESLPPEARLIEEEADPEFNLSGVYRSPQGRAGLLLNYHSRRFMVGVSFEGESVRLRRFENGQVVDSAEMSFGGAAEAPFLLKARRDRISLVVGARRAAIRADGLWEGKLASSGKALDGLRYQPVGPAFLSDDFVRGEGEEGGWEVAAGQWSTRATGDPKMGANPFTYTAQAQGIGLSATGRSYWDDYAFEVSVRPTSGGTVGQGFYCQDQKNYLLFRLRVSDNPGETKDGAEIVRVAEGNESVLGRFDGCLVKGHWYRLSVQVRDGVVWAAVDGNRVATAEEKLLPGGKVALYVRDGQAEFDDVSVRTITEATAPVSVELDGAVPRFAGTLDRDTWAGTVLQWRADPGASGLFWRRGRIHGDFGLAFRCNFADGDAEPAMALLLTMEGGAADSGYGLAVRPAGQTAQASGGAVKRTYDASLTRRGVPVGRCNVAASENPVIELRRVGARVLALVDGRQALECQMAEPPGQLPQIGFLATGFRPRISGLRLRATNVLDYCFDRAPADWWIGSGTWELAVRWPCTPEWSWFAGESRKIAALWHKQRFAGDVTLDLHVGPRTVDHGDGNPREICRAFNVVLCGDGQDVRSGYSFVVGVGRDGAGATLTRNGVEVARNAAYRIFSDAHNQWLNVRAEKQSAAVHLWVGDQRVLSFEDPIPLAGGRLGIWTEDNAVMIPRATIYYREPLGGAPVAQG